MDHTIVAKITASGQVSLPAPVRRRWKASQVVIADEGDRVVLRPLPDDPIAGGCGGVARGGPLCAGFGAAHRRAAAARERGRLGR